MQLRQTVFISGPIQGAETNQEYRTVLFDIFRRAGYGVVDPWERERVLYRGNEHRWWDKVPPNDFVKRDLQDIEQSDLLVAYLPFASAGTCMELFYAKLMRKKTLCVCTMDNPSPWIVVHCDLIVRDFAELEKALVDPDFRRTGLEKER